MTDYGYSRNSGITFTIIYMRYMLLFISPITITVTYQLCFSSSLMFINSLLYYKKDLQFSL